MLLDAPRKFKPHSYQTPVIAHIQEHTRCNVWAPTGGGKTAMVLMALDELSLVEDVWPALVLAPVRVCETVWPVEPGKWTQTKHLIVNKVLGSAAQRLAALRAPGHIYTMNYDNLPWLVAHFGDKWPFKTVIADEATKLKGMRVSQGSKRAQALSKIAFLWIARFVNLTGTPSPNGLKDLWGQNWFVDKGARLGRSFAAYEGRWFKTGRDGYTLEPFPHSQAEIEAKLKDVTITVTGLPVDEPIFNTIKVSLPPAARKHYRDMEKTMFMEIEQVGVEAFNAATKTSKLQQIANGAAYTVVGDAESWKPLHDAKLDALESIVEEAAGMPVLVSYSFKSDLARLTARFPQAQVMDKKGKVVAPWNRGEVPLLLGHPASMGHGLDMGRGGNIIVYFGLDWNLEEYLQIMGRIGPQRQAQAGLDRPVFVHHICAADTIDEGILDRLRGKTSVQDALLNAMKRRR